MSAGSAPTTTDRPSNARASLASALLDDLTEADLDYLAERLRPRLTTPTDDGWLRGARDIADYVDAKVSRIYALSSQDAIPLHRDGSTLLARKSELDEWVRNGGAIRLKSRS